MSAPLLSLAGRRLLLRLAREAIAARLTRGSIDEGDPAGAVPEELHRPLGAFVSLHREGELRGCIGSLEGGRTPLHRTVVEMAVAAATEDHRFAPLRPEELRYTEIELSVLGLLAPTRPGDVVVGEHGLYVVQGRYRGVLLPQVPVQYGWDRETFLGEACRKAGLHPGAWVDPDTRLFGFTAEVFSDAQMAEDPDAGTVE